MKRTLRRFFQLVLLAVCIASTVLLLRQFRDNAGGSEAYDAALEIALSQQTADVPASTEADAADDNAPTAERWVPAPITEEDPNLETMAAINLEALRQVNPDVIGWVMIPDTKINYPILQGTDNDYYLGHTWQGVKNSVGSIFMEYRNTPDFTDYNTILYGHNMNDGSMFANL